jgi:LysM repeat protein/ABC-type branched-subunit amino acid transport system substrate-binding protein
MEMQPARSELLILAHIWEVSRKNNTMRNFLWLVIFLIATTAAIPVYPQDVQVPGRITEDGKTFILHPVKAGETLYSIGKLYGVEVVLILNNNPQLVAGLKSGDTLRIPVTTSEQLSPVADTARMPEQLITHDVQRRETLYSISRQYGVTIDDILNFNPGLGQLRRGDKIRIPRWSSDKSVAVTHETAVPEAPGTDIHIVVAGETLYAISRKYNTSVQQIRDLNPGADALKPGMQLKVPGGRDEIPGGVYIPAPVREEFTEHTIVAGETLFSLTRKYNVTAERLVELNPVLDGTFRTGTVVRIPVAREISSDDNFLKHVVTEGETIFRLTQNYRVSAEDLKKWNPFLEYRNMIPGDTIRLVPGLFAEEIEKEPAQVVSVSRSECDHSVRPLYSRQPVNVVMLLPLMATTNNALNSDNLLSGFVQNEEFSVSPDSVRIMRNERNPLIRFQGNSENFIHFYEGALIALDSLQRSGIKVDLRVFDTENKESRVRQLIATDQLKGADLIIGPVYQAEQKEVAEYALRNHIPLVSPLSATDEHTRSNPWFFQINTPREIIHEITAEYVAERYGSANFIILRTGRQNTEPENDLIAQVRQKVNGNATFRNCDFQKSGLAGLREMVMADRKNVILLTSGNEADVSVGLSNIHTLAPGFDITVIANSRLHQFESINQEYFHDGQLEFLAPYWPDYSKPVTRSFVRKFRDNFRTEPNQFSMQGYDVTFFFVKAASDFGRDFRGCLGSINPELVQGNYRFSQLPGGGFVNKGLSVVKFTRDYRVVATEVSRTK